jgi:hypothetical protein
MEEKRKIRLEAQILAEQELHQQELELNMINEELDYEFNWDDMSW